jgi:hypothetical protein
MPRPPDPFYIAPAYQPLLARAGLTPQSLFTDPRIHPWRSIPERENCTLDLADPDLGQVRLHVKRHRHDRRAAAEEARGIQLLQSANIPTAPLVAHGALPDGRSVLVTADLADYRAADKAIAAGHPFDQILEKTARLAAQLHTANLHHRDLYLCHFFLRPTDNDLQLIDAARVRKLPRLTRHRWIIKDLAQFWYSTLSLKVTDPQRTHWLQTYAQARALSPTSLHPHIQKKVHRIARHDAHLKTTQPTRNVSIPDA